MSEENKGYPDGTQRLIHCTVESFKLNTVIKNKDGNEIGRTGRGAKILTDDQRVERIQIPEGMLSGKALQIPRNAQLLKDLEKVEEDEIHTIQQIKEDGYWRIVRIQKGKIGTAAIYKEGVDPYAKNKPSSGYNAAGPIIGKLENWAMNRVIEIAPEKATFNQILAKAAQYLEEADASLVHRINEAATALYQEAYEDQPFLDGEDEQEDEPAEKPKAAKPKPKAVEEEPEEEEEEEPKPKRKPRATKEEMRKRKEAEAKAAKEAEDEGDVIDGEVVDVDEDVPEDDDTPEPAGETEEDTLWG